MAFANTAQRLDGLISKLENELGERSVSINPDDPWALQRLKKNEVSPIIGLVQCKCGYKLTTPFEHKCPQCSFKGSDIPEAFHLPSIEEMLAALPKRSAPKEKAAEKKPAPVKASGQNSAPAGGKDAPKSSGPASGSGAAAAGGLGVDAAWAKVGIRVGKIVSVGPHPGADSLFVCKVDIGEAEPRPVCAGLRKYYDADQLNGRLICTITNLKPSKLKGELSAAMILAGSHDGQVKLLEPPANSQVGDAIFLEGEKPSENVPKVLNSKHWKEVVADFKAKDGKGAVGGKFVVTGNGYCSVPLPDGSEIH